MVNPTKQVVEDLVRRLAVHLLGKALMRVQMRFLIKLNSYLMTKMKMKMKTKTSCLFSTLASLCLTCHPSLILEIGSTALVDFFLSKQTYGYKYRPWHLL